jgi:hypothetical protein
MRLHGILIYKIVSCIVEPDCRIYSLECMFSLGIESIIVKLVQSYRPGKQLKREVEFSIQLNPKILKYCPIPLDKFNPRYVYDEIEYYLNSELHSSSVEGLKPFLLRNTR